MSAPSLGSGRWRAGAVRLDAGLGRRVGAGRDGPGALPPRSVRRPGRRMVAARLGAGRAGRLGRSGRPAHRDRRGRPGWRRARCRAGAASGAAASRVVTAPRVVVPLRRRGSVPELALERVTHTRLGQWQLLAGGRRRAGIEARRRPGTGELLWSVTCDGDGVGDGDGHGDGPGDQVTRAQVERAIAQLSAEFGAPPSRERPSRVPCRLTPGTGSSAPRLRHALVSAES